MGAEPTDHADSGRGALASNQNRTSAALSMAEAVSQEGLFRNSFVHAAIGFSVADLNGRYLEVNPAYCAITGYTETELRSLDFQTVTHPDDLPRTTAQIGALLAGEIPAFVMEKRYVRKGGEIVWVKNSVSVIRDREGRPVNLLRLSEDITEQKRLQQALQESESRFRLLMHNLPGFAWIKDAEGRYVYMNNRLQSVLPNLNNDWAGKTDEDFWSGDIADEYRRSDLRVFQEKRELQAVESWEYEDQPRTLLVSKFPIFDELGKVIMVGGTSLDITEQTLALDALSKTEAKYRNIFENAGEGIFQSTRQGKYIAANPALARMYGFESTDELMRSASDFSASLDFDSSGRHELKKLMEKEGVARGFELKARRRDGSEMWLSVNARVVRDGQGKTLYYEGTVQDITERKRAEARSAAFATLARRLSGARTQLDAGRIIAQTAKELFGWDACALDLYDADRDLIYPMLNFDTIRGKQLEVGPLILSQAPTPRSKRVINNGPELILRQESTKFGDDAIPFGDGLRPRASLMTVPIRHASNVVGLISIQSNTPNAYDESALKELEALAEHCGEAINRIRAEESLRESEERFRQLADNLEDVLWMTDQNVEKVLYVNQAYERVFGHSCESVYQRLTSYIDTVHPHDRNKVERALEQIKTGIYQPLEYRIIRPGGETRWLLRRAFPIRNSEGEVYRIAGIAQDITERKRAQDELRESEERYRDLVENSREFIYTHDQEGLVISANRATCEALGYDLNDYCGKKNLRDILAPEVGNKFADYLARIHREGVASGLMLVQTSSGERRVWDYHNTLRTEGIGAPIVRGMASDITEQRRAQKALRESEQRYRELFENARDAIYVHDLQGRYISVNRAAERLWGSTRKELLGKHVSNFVSPKHLNRVYKNFRKNTDKDCETTYEVELITKDRRLVPLEVSSRLIYENGKPVAVQGVARDITERKRAHEALRKYAQRVIDAQEAERRRISLELHDQIGQILTAVKINLHGLERICPAPDALACIEDNLKVVDEAFEQVRNLSVDLRPLLLDDFGLAVALRWYLKRQPKSTGVKAQFVSLSLVENERFSSELETACFRIVQEAVTNIIRHAKAKKFSVRLEKRGRSLVLIIKDDGVGFEIMRMRNGVAAAAKLGLRGMEERAEAIGGTMRINSSPGNGTQIDVRFPIRLEKSHGKSSGATRLKRQKLDRQY